MTDFFIFWDKQNDSPEILDERGEFWFYGEDSVAIAQNHSSGRYWSRLEKLTDITPLNSGSRRFEILDWKTGEWVEWYGASFDLIRQVQKLAGVKDWYDVC